MAGEKVIAVNDLNFDVEVLGSGVPVLVDFSATWCQPCRAIAPLVDQLAGEYQGRVKVTTVDIDESPATAQKFRIRGVPTLLMIKEGKVVGQQVGAVPKAKIQQLIESGLVRAGHCGASAARQSGNSAKPPRRRRRQTTFFVL